MKIGTSANSKYYLVLSTVRFADGSLVGYEFQIVDKDTYKTVDGGGLFQSIHQTLAVAKAIIEKLDKEKPQ